MPPTKTLRSHLQDGNAPCATIPLPGESMVRCHMVSRLSAVGVLSAVLIAGGCSKTEAPGRTLPAAGTITLAVDAREVDRKIFHARETIPANPGPLTLVYPKWLPGEHAPTGPITDLAGLRFLVGGKPIAWTRDPVDMYAFHVEVPAGVQSIDVSLDFLSATSTSGFSSGASVTRPRVS